MLFMKIIQEIKNYLSKFTFNELKEKCGINDENEDNGSSIVADQAATIRAANAFTPVTINKK